MFKSLYEEFGEEEVGRVRREITVKLDRIPSYLELLTELCLRQGPSTPPLEPTQKENIHK